MAWNRPTSNTVDATSSSRPSGRGKMPRLRNGVIAGAVIIVALGALCLYLFTNGEADSRPLQKRERGRIKEVTPAAAPTNRVATAEKPRKEEPQRFGEIRNGYRLLPNGKLVKVVGVETSRCARVTLAEKIFDDPSDESIGSLLTIEPGTPMIGKSSAYYGNFEELFRESLKKPIIIAHDDPPEAKELKQAVIDARKELKEKLDAGEDVVQVMRETRDQLYELGAYRAELQKEVETIASDPNKEFTKEDMRELVEAANKMLEERGSKPLAMDGPMFYMFRKEQLRLQAEKEENK